MRTMAMFRATLAPGLQVSKLCLGGFTHPLCGFFNPLECLILKKILKLYIKRFYGN